MAFSSIALFQKFDYPIFMGLAQCSCKHKNHIRITIWLGCIPQAFSRFSEIKLSDTYIFDAVRGLLRCTHSNSDTIYHRPPVENCEHEPRESLCTLL